MPPGAIDLDDVPERFREAVAAAIEAAGVGEGHVSLELVDSARIRRLNAEYLGHDEPTDVLAFPVDGAGSTTGPRELGDIFISPGDCRDTVEAAVHGTLHLCGYDHERDRGEMLVLQDSILRKLRGGT